jgi:exodeoxyribonuclease V beta subunit
LHAVLETEDFSRGDVALLAVNIEKQMLKSGLPLSDNTAAETAAWLLDVLAAPIDLRTELQKESSKGVLKLNQLSARQRLNEWQFLLGCKSIDIAAFCRVLAKPEFNVEPRFIAAAQRLKPEKFAGYLNGFVDLVFFWQGQYFIADYKSNHLGDKLADYAPEQLIEVMSDSHYYLQYLLYVCAWHRHMQSRQGASYDYTRDFGGVLYLFIRGISSQQSNCGVYQDIPSIELIEALNATLGLGAEQ